MELHVSIPEVLWTLAALVGVVFRARLMRDALEDRQASRVLDADPALGLIVAGRVRNESVGLAVKIGFVIIGIYAMTRPNPPGGVGQGIVAAVLIVSVVLLDWNSWMTDRERVRLRTFVEEHP